MVIFTYYRKVLNIIRKKEAAAFQMDDRDTLYADYSEKAKKQGFDDLYVLLSFDCDTPRDIPAAEEIFFQLKQLGIKPTFCVPGEQLIEGAKTYRKLSEQGAEFINHGAAPHTEWKDGAYRSRTFYHLMSPEEIKKDIIEGHRIFYETLGYYPVGFRAPHFGTFQKPEQRKIIYDTLSENGYRFSSSTLPDHAFLYGVLEKVNDDLYEVPLSGSYQYPKVLFDSWSYVESEFNPKVKEIYAEYFIETLRQLSKIKIVGIINFYMDPYHVINTKSWMKILSFLKNNHFRTTSYNQLLEKIKEFKK